MRRARWRPFVDSGRAEVDDEGRAAGPVLLAARWHHVNFVFQQHVTHGLPISDEKLDEVVEIAAHHVRVLGEWSDVAVGDGRFFDFGAGWDLHVAQTLYCLGVDRQTVVDIRSLLKERLVLDIRNRHRLPRPVRCPCDRPR
jgi:hypothetical protein